MKPAGPPPVVGACLGLFLGLLTASLPAAESQTQKPSVKTDAADAKSESAPASPAAAATRPEGDGAKPPAPAAKAEVLPPRNAGLPAVDPAEIPAGGVLAEVFEFGERAEGAGADWGQTDGKAKFSGYSAAWDYLPTSRTQVWSQSEFAVAHLPPRYSARGSREDRSVPFVVRLSAKVMPAAGSHQLLLRAIRGSRVVWDGKPLLSSSISFKLRGEVRASAAEPVPDLLELQLVKTMALLKPGHSETLGTVDADGREHLVSFEFFVGGKNLRPEPGAPVLALCGPDGAWRVLRPGLDGPQFNDEEWGALVVRQRAAHEGADHGKLTPAAEERYWAQRHAEARKALGTVVPKHPVFAGVSSEGMIDALLLQKRGGLPVGARSSDAAFLRRASLDVTGLPPGPGELDAFLKDGSADKRRAAVERLLAGPGWAHQWVPYWQDVLAENPALLKATLNNTGPFRWFLYDALRDNWPADRFATELIAMRGSVRDGGAGGFELASQNDLPMAHKAQILGSAFLAMEMKCARCHDAPNHPFDQKDLFAVSAMLGRKSMKVPETSLTKGLKASSHVTVSLKAGQVIEPGFPFQSFPGQGLPGAVREDGDSREKLAAVVTDPRNTRFAEVLANRVWKRLMGWALVEPVDDWDDQRPSHPELLEWLGRRLVELDYDMKALARTVMLSEAYQREADPVAHKPVKADARVFAAPARRRLSAEQLLDSLFFVCGKSFEAEPLNFDLDGRRSAKDFTNLGEPYRAWHLVGLSNERDRPSLAKPVAQALGDILRINGWRESRAEPRTAREDAPNLLQPAIVANGVIGGRVIRFSDDSAFTRIALEAATPVQFAEALYRRILSRSPSRAEAEVLAGYVAEGFENRVRACAEADMPRKPRSTKAVMWSNHLHPDSTTAIYEAEALLKAGDPVTKRLAPAWRERAEDAVWALLLTPEFSFVP